MEKFKKNLSQLNGLMIKYSDMSYEMKNEVSKVVSSATKRKDIPPAKISYLVCEYLD